MSRKKRNIEIAPQNSPMPVLERFVKDANAVKLGVRLFQALQQSSFINRAVRPLNAAAMIMSDGSRFWTVDAITLSPVTIEIPGGVYAYESTGSDWFPVVGNENGWRAGDAF